MVYPASSYYLGNDKFLPNSDWYVMGPLSIYKGDPYILQNTEFLDMVNI